MNMKLTAQADFYIDHYGVEEGIKYLKSLGYNQIVYAISGRTKKVFADEHAYELFRETLQRYDMKLLFTIHKEEVYSDLAPQTTEGRIIKCIESLRITANMGCEVMAVRPVALRKSIPNALDESKRLTFEIYSDIKEKADGLEIKLAFFNNTKIMQFTSGTYSYGCRGSELLELAGAFNADTAGKLLKITVFNPGKNAEDLKELSENNKNVLYFGTISADSKGKYTFEFKKSEESGFYDIEIETEDGVKEVFTIFSNDKEVSKDIVDRLNGATSEEEFYRLLYGTDKNFRELGFYMNDSESVGLKNLSGLLYEYVKNTAEFSEDDNIERIKIFRKMYAIAL